MFKNCKGMNSQIAYVIESTDDSDGEDEVTSKWSAPYASSLVKSQQPPSVVKNLFTRNVSTSVSR